MRRAAIVLAMAAAASVVPAPAAPAGLATADVYRSQFLAVDRGGRTYSIEATVEDRPAGTQLVLEVRRRCEACKPVVYAKALEPGQLRVNYLSFGAECQCFSARVETKFGGKPLTIDWAWDPEQDAAPAGGSVEWATVTANNLLNVGCFGTGSVTSTPQAFSGEPPAPPAGAKEFPKKMPAPFRADPMNAPGCHADRP